MRVNTHCADCLWNRQLQKTDNSEYLSEVWHIINSRKENDTAPYLVYLFNQAYERHFGKTEAYK